MANQPETISYDAGVYQLETTDAVDGGVGAKSNAPLLALANRTAYLKKHMDDMEAGNTVPPGFALLASPSFTGSPTAPTQAAGDNSTKLATTAFVQTTVNGTVSVSIAGAATTTLSQAQYGPQIIKLTGAVTANKAVVFPNISGHWQVINNTTGAFTVTLKTAAGAGVVISNGSSTCIYGDGANITLQQTDFISPDLTGVPTAPTATAGTNTTQIATTAFVAALGALKANLASPALTGTPTAPTAPAGTSTTQIATTAFVQQAANGLLTKSVAGAVDVTLTAAEAGASMLKFTGALTGNVNVIVPTAASQWLIINGTTGAYTLTVKTASGTGIAITQGLNWGVICDGTNVIDGLTDFYSTVLSGTPTAPTAAVNTSTTQIATTAFVLAQAATATPQALGTAAVGNATRFARENHVHAMPTLDALANTTITSNANGEILRWNGTAWVNNTLAEAGIAPVASPTFTGDPKAPTPAAGDTDTSIATTAFVQDAIGGSTATSVAGSGTTTLTAVQAGVGSIVLTGALTGNKIAALPTVKGRWTIVNNTTGNYTLTIKYASGTGVLVPQGAASNVWGDGVNIALQQTDFTDIALRGTSTAPTAPLFDSTTQLATTAFVQRALGNLSAASVLSANTTLNSSSYGKITILNPNNPFTVTLPSTAGIPSGSQLLFRNVGSHPVTLNCAAGDTLGNIATLPLSTIQIQPGSSLDLITQGTVYWMSGSAALGFSSEFGSQFALPGFQKLPSGLVIQWGTASQVPIASTTPGAFGPTVDVTLPVAFPTAGLRVFATYDFSTMATTASYACGGVLVSRSVIRLQNNYCASAGNISWLAVGY